MALRENTMESKADNQDKGKASGVKQASANQLQINKLILRLDFERHRRPITNDDWTGIVSLLDAHLQGYRAFNNRPYVGRLPIEIPQQRIKAASSAQNSDARSLLIERWADAIRRRKPW